MYNTSNKTEALKPIHGIVEKIVSHDPTNGYTILKVANSQIQKRVETVMTHMPTPYVGVKMKFHGNYHFQNGSSVFRADYVYEKRPKALTEIRKYLGSGIINGLDENNTKNIARHFKENTLEILDKNIGRLIEVDGISVEKIPEIQNSWNAYKMTQEIMHFLQSHKLKAIYAVQAYRLYEKSTIEKVQENPYRLLQDIDGINFFDVDQLASSMGIEENNPERLSAAVMHIFSGIQQFGHCCLTSAQIYEGIYGLFKSNISDKVGEHLRYMREQELVKTRKLRNKHGDPQLFYYEPEIFFNESYVANKISRNDRLPEIDLKWIEHMVEGYQKSELQLTKEQTEAVIGVICSKYSVLTGGPGTGKTATLKAVVYLLKALKLKFNIVAPTGRAAQRIKELIDEDAQTIHRLLGGCHNFFQYNEKKPLYTDFIIIDESSMLSINLTAALLKAVPNSAQILFVGDPDQLPAINPGNVLKDLIDSETVDVYRLTQIFRQSEGSLIIDYAHQINKGRIPLIQSPMSMEVWEKGVSCLFYDSEVAPKNRADTPHLHENEVYDIKSVEKLNSALDGPTVSKKYKERKGAARPPYHQRISQWSTLCNGLYAEEVITKLYTEVIPKYYANAEIQVLTPMKKESLGSENLNIVIQDASNPYAQNKRQLATRTKTFRVGDRVIQCNNNYNIGVFNGEIGAIKAISDKNLTCTISYPGNRSIQYNHKELLEIDHAYAITVHKAQGSEFDVVIIPIHEQHSPLLFRSLLYTALTRAKKAVIFVGQQSTLHKAILNNSQSVRQTGLKELLKIATEKNKRIDFTSRRLEIENNV